MLTISGQYSNIIDIVYLCVYKSSLGVLFVIAYIKRLICCGCRDLSQINSPLHRLKYYLLSTRCKCVTVSVCPKIQSRIYNVLKKLGAKKKIGSDYYFFSSLFVVNKKFGMSNSSWQERGWGNHGDEGRRRRSTSWWVMALSLCLFCGEKNVYGRKKVYHLSYWRREIPIWMIEYFLSRIIGCFAYLVVSLTRKYSQTVIYVCS